MSINHCQNLWAQFAKVDQAQKVCAGVLDLAIKESEVHFATLLQELDRFASEVQKMQEAWDGSFITLPDGRLLFGPESEALAELIRSSGANTDMFVAWGLNISNEGYVDGINFNVGETVSDLSILSRFAKLAKLSFNSNENVDFSEVVKLGGLRNLRIKNSVEEDLSILGTLTDLESLSLEGAAGLEDFSFLNGLTKLRSLDLERTMVIDLEVLSTLLNLQSLVLSDTEITDFSVLNNLPKLATVICNRPMNGVDQLLRERGVNVIT